MIFKKEKWGYGLELTGYVLLLAGILLQVTLNTWDEKLADRQYLIQEEINLAILSSLNDIASMQSTDDKEFIQSLSKNVEDVTNDAYSSTMAEKQRRSIAKRNDQKTRFLTLEFLLMLIGILFIVRGRWVGFQGIKNRDV